MCLLVYGGCYHQLNFNAELETKVCVYSDDDRFTFVIDKTSNFMRA